ncbi:MAG: glycosyltransferase family 9 protein [Planctomycetota bacterium]|jgi:ADP-heptose:LPS heptosyltransferase
MKRVLVIQLERLSEVIQTTPLLQDIAAAHPKCTIDLMLLAGNPSIVEGLPGLGTIFTLPEAEVYDLNREVQACFRKKQIPACTSRKLASLNLPAYDRVINLTHGAFSAWIASRVPAAEREGGIITKDGEWLFCGAWHSYLIALIDFRRENRFNLVDLYRGSGPHPIAPDRRSGPYCAKAPFEHRELPKGIRIALNPGAARPRRRWPSAYFADLADRLASQGLEPFLVGSRADRKVCEKVASQCRTPLPDFSGRTTVPELAGLLSQAALLVSNETGAVHLAASAGIPVVGLYGSSASFRETAPWGEGHLILHVPRTNQEEVDESGESDERWEEPIEARVVEAAVLERLGKFPQSDLRKLLDQRGLEAWETFFLPAWADPLGGLSTRPIHSEAWNPEELLCIALRHGLAAECCGKGEAIRLDYLAERSRAGQASLHGFLEAAACFQEQGGLFAQRLRAMAQTADNMHALARSYNDGAMEMLSTMGTRLESELSALLEDSEKHPVYKPVISFLNWNLKLLPPLPPEPLFQAYARTHQSAASVLGRSLQHMRRFCESGKGLAQQQPPDGVQSPFSAG